MLKRYYSITALIFMLGGMFYTKVASASSSMPLDEAAAYASFIQNLVSNSSIKKKAGSFCIYGNDSVAKSLARGAGNVVVKNSSADTMRHCKAVYVSVENVANLKSYLRDLGSSKILTISTFDEFVENGGMIQVGMGRRDFELVVDVRALNSIQIKLDTLSTNLIIN